MNSFTASFRKQLLTAEAWRGNGFHRVFSEFDDLVGELGLEEVKTIGDAYLVVAGAPEPRRDHAIAVTLRACPQDEAIVEELGPSGGQPLSVRIGLHSGPVVTGVIRRKKFAYNLWGDAVNVTARMERYGVPGEIQMRGCTRSLRKGRFETRESGPVETKGLGTVAPHFLIG